LPPGAGFAATASGFSAAVRAGYYSLAVIAVLTSVVSVVFYLRIVVMMYMSQTAPPARFPAVPRIAGAALIASAAIVFYLGILPARVLDWTEASISKIF